jgi:hypothetical protein
MAVVFCKNKCHAVICERIAQICVNVMLKVVLYILLRRCVISSQNIVFHVILSYYSAVKLGSKIC